MSSSQAPTEEKVTIPGACHCKTIKFVAHDITPKKAGKCNCSICTAKGWISVVSGPDAVSLVLPDSSEKTINYSNSADASLWPSELGCYSPSLFRGDVEPGKEFARYHFCKICGCQLFSIGNLEVMGGPWSAINLMALDLKSAGLDLKELTKPDGLRYCDGASGKFGIQVGEPWDGGQW